MVCNEDESSASSGLNITSENCETGYAELEDKLNDTQLKSSRISIAELEYSLFYFFSANESPHTITK